MTADVLGPAPGKPSEGEPVGHVYARCQPHVYGPTVGPWQILRAPRSAVATQTPPHGATLSGRELHATVTPPCCLMKEMLREQHRTGFPSTVPSVAAASHHVYFHSKDHATTTKIRELTWPGSTPCNSGPQLSLLICVSALK